MTILIKGIESFFSYIVSLAGSYGVHGQGGCINIADIAYGLHEWMDCFDFMVFTELFIILGELFVLGESMGRQE